MSEEKTRIVPRTPAKVAGGSITFHCDNGHRINVPVGLAGKRGTCSKCGISVVIPLATSAAPEQPPAPADAPGEEAAAAAPADTFANLFEPAAPEPAAVAEEILVDVTGGGSAVGSGVGGVVAGDAPYDLAAPNETDAEHPTAQLVARLWLERAHGGVVELHLTGGGSPILPDWFEPRWSRGTHGLFATQTADGKITLTAVAWDSIQKIVVRQVEGLPDGMFE